MVLPCDKVKTTSLSRREIMSARCVRGLRESWRENDSLTHPPRTLVGVDEEKELSSLAIVLAQVTAERETINAHAESLDSKAGVALGFASVLVGLGATAQVAVSGGVIFQIGLAVAVVAAFLAA